MRSFPANESHELYWWSCNTSDPDPQALCKQTLEHDPRAIADAASRTLTVDATPLRPNQTYIFTVHRVDRRISLGIPTITYTQEVSIVPEPVPELHLTCKNHCNTIYVLPDDFWILNVECLSCKQAYYIPVFYEWSIA